MLNYVLDLFFPKRCAGCGREGSYFCSKCKAEITYKDLICPACKRIALGGKTHGRCYTEYGLDGLWSYGAFQKGLRVAIQKLKYKFITEQADVLIDLLITDLRRSRTIFIDEIIKDQGQNWVITGVPLHWQRQNWRGFNQSELLAKKLALKLQIPYVQLLKRGVNTTSQTHFNAEERQKNIKNAFSLTTRQRRGSPGATVHCPLNTNILIIDDVWTTGSTITECCDVLKKNGANQVWALTMAR